MCEIYTVGLDIISLKDMNKTFEKTFHENHMPYFFSLSVRMRVIGVKSDLKPLTGKVPLTHNNVVLKIIPFCWHKKFINNLI